jgi:hypothetical protein
MHQPHGPLAIWCDFVLVNDCEALVFDGTATPKTALFIALSVVLHESPLFRAHFKIELNARGLNLAIGGGCCLWGIRHSQELLSQAEVILELLNNVVTFTSASFGFPTVHNLHCASHVIYNSLESILGPFWE